MPRHHGRAYYVTGCLATGAAPTPDTIPPGRNGEASKHAWSCINAILTKPADSPRSMPEDSATVRICEEVRTEQGVTIPGEP